MSGGPAAVVLLAGAWMTWDAGRCLRARVTHAITTGRDERARWAAWEANRSVIELAEVVSIGRG